MAEKIRVAILDDHQLVVDGYLYRLSNVPEVEVAATATRGDQLWPMLAEHAVDVLILDVNVPVALDNNNPYPILHDVPQILQTYPDLQVLVISMHDRPTLVNNVLQAGASGYILKDDAQSTHNLGRVIRQVARGELYFSERVRQQLQQQQEGLSQITKRQQEALSLVAAQPDITTAEGAARLGVAPSSFRNLLSNAYIRLDVGNRAAAIAKARQLGLITPYQETVDLQALQSSQSAGAGNGSRETDAD